MKLVVDANVVISALIADSKTRELVVTLGPELLTPEVVHDEIGNYEALIVEKSGMELERVRRFIDLLFQYIETMPAGEFYPYIEEAEEAIGDTDPDDVLYVASVPAIIGLALTLYRWWGVTGATRLQAAIALVLPGTVLDALATAWFETVFPNMVPGATGYFGGMLLLACASVLLSGFVRRV